MIAARQEFREKDRIGQRKDAPLSLEKSHCRVFNLPQKDENDCRANAYRGLGKDCREAGEDGADFPPSTVNQRGEISSAPEASAELVHKFIQPA